MQSKCRRTIWFGYTIRRDSYFLILPTQFYYTLQTAHTVHTSYDDQSSNTSHQKLKQKKNVFFKAESSQYHIQFTLYVCRFSTTHAKIASRPTVMVMFCSGSANFGRSVQKKGERKSWDVWMIERFSAFIELSTILPFCMNINWIWDQHMSDWVDLEHILPSHNAITLRQVHNK